MIKSSYFRLFFALCVSASLFACSEDKADPGHSDKCSATPIASDCLEGTWNLTEVGNPTCHQTGRLVLKANKDYDFAGEFTDAGTWDFSNGIITINGLQAGSLSGKVTVTESGKKMLVEGSGASSVFSLCEAGGNSSAIIVANSKKETFTYFGEAP